MARDTATAIVGAVLGAMVAWAIVAVLTVASGPDATRPDERVAASSVGVLSGWDVSGAAWQRSVVQVRNQRCGDSISGTGVVVGGRILTNVHVVAGAARLEVGTHDGRSIRVVAVSVSGSVDLAELVLEDGHGLGPGVSLASGEFSQRTGDRWTMAGFPAGRRFLVREVGVTGTLHGGRFPDPARAWHLDAGVAGGESGSPIVDGSGRLAGLLYARALVDGDGLAMDASTIREARSDLIARPFESC